MTRRSAIWLTDKNLLMEIVNKSQSLADILRALNIFTVGRNYITIKRRLEEDEIDFSHIQLGRNNNKGRRFPPSRTRIPDEKLFTKDSMSRRGSIKRRIIYDNLINYICNECGQEPLWKNKKLTLVLDHINGIPNDHRLENLQFLCPNCNSQTLTFAGRKTAKNYKGLA